MLSQFKIALKTILIVDDKDLLRAGLVRAFTNKGFNVLEASNAQDALKIVLMAKVDLVISDICMPEENGISLLEKIRRDHTDIPEVIFITGFSDYTEKQCLAKGAKTVFTKPFKIKDLVNEVAASVTS